MTFAILPTIAGAIGVIACLRQLSFGFMRTLAALILIGTAFAQCPVKIQRVFKDMSSNYVPGCGTCNVPGRPTLAAIKYTNESAKTIRAATFKVNHMTAQNEVIEAVDYPSEHKLKSGRAFTKYWPFPDASGQHLGTVWALKVWFEDGTTWEDDGTHSCSYTSEEKR